MPLFSQHTARFSPDVPLEGTSSRELLKRYQPLETLATGGFGSIEICRDTHLRRRVAIKRIPLINGAGMPASDIMDVLREAHTAAMLQHPNIVQVIDFTHDTAYAYLVMEYVDGMSLAEFLHRVDGHSLTFDEAAAIADALGQALTFAHSNGVLHLDIKPANVLIDHSGNVKLTDFGMARLSSAGGFGGSRGGTIGYMPPEQLDIETGTVDERADVFALACVIYEGLCGSAPFMAATPADSLDRIIGGATYPSELIPHFPPGAEAALMSALSPMPQDRPNSIEAFCDQLLAGLGSVREGRRSLEQMVGELSDDERAADDIEPSRYEDDTIEVDPALGWAGTRWSHARDYTMRAISALACGAFSFLLMQTAGVAALPGLVVAAIAIGAAAGLAPQIGSAISAVGFLVLMANATMQAQGILSMLPVAVHLCRCHVRLVDCLGTHRGGRERGAHLRARAWLSNRRRPPCRRSRRRHRGILARPGKRRGGHGHGRAFCPPGRQSRFLPEACWGSAMLPQRWETRSFWAAIVLVAATAAATSAAAQCPCQARRAGLEPCRNRRHRRRRHRLARVSFCLAHHMEIASLAAAVVAKAAVAGTLSSIIVGICLYLLGYQRTYTESDLS